MLLFTAYWIAPFLAVVAIDWRDRRNGVNRETLVHMLEWRNLRSGWPALLSLVVGFGLMVPFMDTGLIEGPVARHLDGADLSFVVGFVVAGALVLPAAEAGRPPRAGIEGTGPDCGGGHGSISLGRHSTDSSPGWVRTFR